MKLLKRQISGKDSSGLLVVQPETGEDLWHLYNLVAIGDRIRSTTIRKVMKESATGSTTSQRKRLMLTIAVQKVDFDPESIELRYSGVVSSENEHVRLNSYHTVTVELNQSLSIEKDCWDEIFLNIVDESLHPERQSEVAVIVLQPTGLCHVCLITGSLTITKAKIDINIPKKRTGSTQHAKSTTKFLDSIYQSLLRHIDFTKMKCIVIGSPGFIKNDLYQYIFQQAAIQNNKQLLESKSKFILTRSSSGHKHSIEELFLDPTVVSQMNETKLLQEIQVLQRFMRLLDTDPDRAYYGYDHVRKVQMGDGGSTSNGHGHHQMLAIDTLLVTDELFRSSDVKTRRSYVDLVESVKSNGGSVMILSILHVAGQQLQQISGVAAILRYPVHDIDELEELYRQATTTTTSATNQQENSNGYNHYTEEGKKNSLDDDDDDDESTSHNPLLKRIQEDVQDMGLF